MIERIDISSFRSTQRDEAHTSYTLTISIESAHGLSGEEAADLIRRVTEMTPASDDLTVNGNKIVEC